MSEFVKPTIPTEVADVIENLRDPSGGHVFSNAEIIAIASKTGGALHSDTVTLQKIPFDTLLAALVNGYEREMTKEEWAYANIRVKYLDAMQDIKSYANTLAEVRMSAFADGILFVLNELGVKIEGVNA